MPWYYTPKKIEREQCSTSSHPEVLEGKQKNGIKSLKSWFERHLILPRIDHLVATSQYTADCIEKYCGRKAVVVHPVIMMNEEAKAKEQAKEGVVGSGNVLNQ